MKRKLTASAWREVNWFVAQCMEIDVATKGATVEEALATL